MSNPDKDRSTSFVQTILSTNEFNKLDSNKANRKIPKIKMHQVKQPQDS